MEETQYLVLLSGINVGGNNIIRMSDLKSCFEKMGYANVQTYIQSGNVLFRTDHKDLTKLTSDIEVALTGQFSYKARIVVLNYMQLKKTVEEAPAGFGKEADKYRYDVLFLKESLIPEEVLKNIKIKEGVDSASAGESVLYFSRLISRASQSYLTKIITQPVYQNITIRNWNTTTKLLTLMESNT
jgi:uncharacterized protein (DUF1697 family)